MKLGSDCDGQPVPPRIRVVVMVNIMVERRALSAMPVAACGLVRKGASFDIESVAPVPLKRRGNFRFVNGVG